MERRDIHRANGGSPRAGIRFAHHPVFDSFLSAEVSGSFELLNEVRFDGPRCRFDVHQCQRPGVLSEEEVRNMTARLIAYLESKSKRLFHQIGETSFEFQLEKARPLEEAVVLNVPAGDWREPLPRHVLRLVADVGLPDRLKQVEHEIEFTRVDRDSVLPDLS